MSFPTFPSLAVTLTAACPALAESYDCVIAGTPLQFTIDHSQFAPAHDPGEPPRRKVSIVQFGDRQFPAEPFMIGDMRGFSAEALGGATAIFAVAADGAATYAVARTGERLTGQCEVTQ